jgi:ABC-type Fe3+/spermidine/putrescine transport system ATPase subunit
MRKEALSIADRIAVMKDGRLAQVGTPGELYQKPKNRFVADFIGNTNLISATITGRNGNRIELNSAAGPLVAIGDGELPKTVTVSIRPEQMEIINDDSPANGRNRLSGKTIGTTFLGEASEHVLLVNDTQVRVISTPPLFDPPQQMRVEFDPEDVIVLTD